MNGAPGKEMFSPQGGKRILRSSDMKERVREEVGVRGRRGRRRV